MKKLLLLTAGLFLIMLGSNPASAQTYNRCGTTEYTAQQLLKHPGIAKIREKAEAEMQRLSNANPNYKATGGTIIIPVVYHVLWFGAAQNVSDARLLENINVLNNDFAYTNADTVNTPAVFKPFAANTGIQFCMAQRDPNGVATDGIIRKNLTSNITWSANDAMKFTAQGGDDAWPASDYLNIWVCNLGSSLLGYAQFPGGPAATDGIVVLYSSVGGPNAPGTANPYHLGRTATHEVGHWVNLIHINGDSNCGSDLVNDTPTQDILHGGCPNHPYHVNVCAGSSNGEMFMDYMDYSDDVCMNMFTAGQATRIQTAMTAQRPGILVSLGCVPVVVQTLNAGISAIISPSGTICSSSITPVVTIRNYGATTLTSATINYQVDAGAVTPFPWTGNLATNATANVTLPVIAVTAGPHTFNANTAAPNGGSDQDLTNDSETGNFTSAASGAALPYTEGMELPAFPPPSCTIYNPDGLTTWARTITAAKTGVASMWFNSIAYTCNGCIDIITLPNIDLTTIAAPQMTFQVAYRLLSDPNLNPNWSDSLRVDISTDCGITWTNLYFKYSTNLTTIVPPFSTVPFVPTQNDWRLETISLAPFAANGNVLFRFKVSSDYENNMYVDDININSATGVNQVAYDPSFSSFPVPSKGIINILWGSVSKQDISIDITNTLGQSVYSSTVKNYNGTVLPVNLGRHDDGVYFIKVQANDKIINQKIVLQK